MPRPLTEWVCALNHPVPSWPGPCTHKTGFWCHHFAEDVEDPADDAKDPRDGPEALMDVGETLDGLEKHWDGPEALVDDGEALDGLEKH